MTDEGDNGQYKMSGRNQADVFVRIYKAEVAYVHRCLRRLGVHEADLPDKVHDVFVVLHRRLEGIDPTRPMRPWLGGVAVRVAAEYRRRAYRRREVLKEPLDLVDPGPTPEAALADQRDRALVLEALERLDPDQRDVFVLHEIEGYTMPDVAEMIGAPLNTLYSRLRLARKRFTEVARRLRPGSRRGDR